MVRRPRHVFPAIAASLSIAAMLAGCTLLISFDDVPAPSEGGAELPDVTTADMTIGDAGRDVRDGLADPDACTGHENGKYCPGNQIVWPIDRKDDLITCAAGKVASVRYCANGVGCIANIDGYPDECDECVQKDAGTYCGRDMPGWDPKNANQRVRCSFGREVGLLLCAAGCNSAGPASACK